jgi:hypothetical protein
MLEGAIYFLLKKHFRQESYYVDLLELFHEVSLIARVSFLACTEYCIPQTTFQTELGQLIDLITAPEDAVDLSKFSLDKYVPNPYPLPLVDSHIYDSSGTTSSSCTRLRSTRSTSPSPSRCEWQA